MASDEASPASHIGKLGSGEALAAFARVSGAPVSAAPERVLGRDEYSGSQTEGTSRTSSSVR
jgi:hypothetical protein